MIYGSNRSNSSSYEEKKKEEKKEEEQEERIRKLEIEVTNLRKQLEQQGIYRSNNSST